MATSQRTAAPAAPQHANPPSRSTTYYAKNRAKVLARMKAYYAKNRAKVIAAGEKYRKEWSPEKRAEERDKRRKWKRENKDKVRRAQIAYRPKSAVHSAEFRRKNPAYVKAYRAKYKREHPEKVSAQVRAAKRKKRFHYILMSSKWTAKIKGHKPCAATAEEIQAAYDGRCQNPACRKPESQADRLCLDHDHTTGEFRGWACRRCNAALGFVGDCPKKLAGLIAYLKAHEKRKNRKSRAAKKGGAA